MSTGPSKQRWSYLSTESGYRLELLPNRVYVLGRGADCDLLIDDEECSRRHAKISVAGDGLSIWVEDLGSKNGTILDGEPVEARQQLRDGNCLRLGNAVFVAHTWNRGTLDGQIKAPSDTHTAIFDKTAGPQRRSR